MAHTETPDVATQSGPVDDRPRLFSADAFATGLPEGLPLLVFTAIAASSSPGKNAFALGAIAAFVLGDLVVYLIRHPPPPSRAAPLAVVMGQA